GRHETAEHRSHLAFGLLSLLQELDPSDPDLVVDYRHFSSRRDLGVVCLLAIDAVLRKLDEHTAGTDTVLGEIGPHRGAAVNRESRTLRCRHHHALFVPLSLTSLILLSSISRQ